MGGKRLKAATRNLAANHLALLLFNHSLNRLQNQSSRHLFPNHVLVVKAIIVPVIDAFFHSSIVVMLQ
jgi:hypothetical protein